MFKLSFSKPLGNLYVRRCLAGILLGALLSSPAAAADTVIGTITAIDRASSSVTLEAGGESARYLIGRGDRAILEAGDQVRGRRVRQGDDWRLERIFPADPEHVAVVARLGEQLQRETLRRGIKAFRTVGERVPRFALWDQRGDLFLSERLRGDYFVLNFVFTRCPMPEMCAAATLRMQELDSALDERGWDDVQLVSITLDPEFDTPGIWTAYADDRGIDGTRHHLLAGPAETVDALKKQLGVLAEPDKEQIVRHTMSTALVDPTGKIIYRIPGSRWDPEVFLRQIEQDRRGGKGES